MQIYNGKVGSKYRNIYRLSLQSGKKRGVLVSRGFRALRAGSSKKMRSFQSRELKGYSRNAINRVRIFPGWVVNTFRSMLAGLVAMTLGMMSPASAASGKRKPAAVKKAGQLSKGITVNSSATASVTISKPASMRFSAEHDQPDVEAEARYHKIKSDDGNITYNFE